VKNIYFSQNKIASRVIPIFSGWRRAKTTVHDQHMLRFKTNQFRKLAQLDAHLDRAIGDIFQSSL